MHKCISKNELNQKIEIENSLYIYASNDEFYGDFDIQFCPICGKHLQPKRIKREDMEGPSHLPDRGWPDKNAGCP